MKKFACTQCRYVYRPAFGEEELGIDPGTPFESLPESFACPACGAGEEFFQWIEEPVNEITDPDDPSEAEAVHVPVFREDEGAIVVTLGFGEDSHPNEDYHFIEWLALVDEDGEVIEARARPDPRYPVRFDGYCREDFSEVRASCSVHGVWKWVPQSVTENE